MESVDLFSAHGPAYLLAASLTAVAFVLWKAGARLVTRSPRDGRRVLWWGLALVVWMLAAVVAHAAWVALG